MPFHRILRFKKEWSNSEARGLLQENWCGCTSDYSEVSNGLWGLNYNIFYSVSKVLTYETHFSNAQCTQRTQRRINFTSLLDLHCTVEAIPLPDFNSLWHKAVNDSVQPLDFHLLPLHCNLTALSHTVCPRAEGEKNTVFLTSVKRETEILLKSGRM